jgi:hypothetical protein
MKLGVISSTTPTTYFSVWSANDDNSSFDIYTYPAGTAYPSDRLCISGYSTNFRWTNAVFRDPSAWYHCVVAVDTALNSQNSIRVYVNGVEQTSFYYNNNPAAGANLGWGQASTAHRIGVESYIANVRYFDGYMTDVYYIDGQALDSSYFGQLDTNSGQWIPKAYSGSYGTNGFYLNFSNSSNLGADSAPISGGHTAANNWTPTNFASHEQVLDSPTNNFCTLNPLNDGGVSVDKPIQGNLAYKNSFPYTRSVPGVFGISSGKWYWECWRSTAPDGQDYYGVCREDLNHKDGDWNVTLPKAVCYASNGSSNRLYNLSSTYTAYGTTFTTNDVVSVLLDCDSGTITFWINGTTQGTATTGLSGTWFPFVGSYGGYATRVLNFGQGGQTGLSYDAASGGRFKYTPPSGFKALSTANLLAPTIKKPGQYFNVMTYTGTGGARSITGVGYQPDLVWIKDRDGGNHSNLFDSVRGPGKILYSSLTNTEYSSSQALTAFSSDGFSLGDGSDNGTNTNNNRHVAWCWKANGASAVANNAGSIASQVSANQQCGFSIVTFTANGLAGATVGHGLGAVPAFIALKDRDASNWWTNYHQSLGATKAVHFHLSDAADASTLYWNDTSPTSSVFTLGAGSNPNYNTHKYIAYLWAEVPGFSRFGSYTGNGSADGPFVYCGFKPRLIFVKRSDSAASGGNWYIYDSARDSYNVVSHGLCVQTAQVEFVSTQLWDFTANGFKVRSTENDINASGATYIFAAFAEAPFKYATAK